MHLSLLSVHIRHPLMRSRYLRISLALSDLQMFAEIKIRGVVGHFPPSTDYSNCFLSDNLDFLAIFYLFFSFYFLLFIYLYILHHLILSDFFLYNFFFF